MSQPALYLDDWSAEPGTVLRVRATATRPESTGIASATLVRLTGLQGPGVPTGYVEHAVAAAVELALVERDVPAGSCAHAAHGPEARAGADWRWDLRAYPTLGAAGELLAWGDPGPRLRLVGGRLTATWHGRELALPIDVRAWSAITLEARGGTLALRVVPVGADAWHRRTQVAETPTGAGAAPEIAGPLRFGSRWNGRIEDPALVVDGALVAHWHFADGMTTQRVPGRGPAGVELRLVNAPRRAVTSSAWDGSVHDWRSRPEHYSAIHFHDDDIADCEWSVDAELRVPADCRSGVYAVRLRASDGGVRHTPVFVGGAGRARIAFLASTFSYLAYANSIWEPPSRCEADHPTDAALARRFGLSTYCRHRDGSGIGLVSLRRPVLNLTPGFVGEAIGGQALMNDDLRIVAWLERRGEPYDVVTDHDLHRRGAEALAAYDVVVTGSHPEYQSRESLAALERFAARGGRLMYMGGNGFYWRVTTLPDAPHVLELRRAEGGVRKWAEPAGEYHHQSDGELGGLWRRLGNPPNRLVGVGYSAQGFEDDTRHYVRTAASADPRVAFLFAGIEGRTLGRDGPLGAAAGYELDRADVRLGTPPHALVVARSAPFGERTVPVVEEVLTPGRVDAEDPVRADLTFYEGPNGGAVLATGSILFAGALEERDGAGRLVDNALDRFLDPAPFRIE